MTRLALVFLVMLTTVAPSDVAATPSLEAVPTADAEQPQVAPVRSPDAVRYRGLDALLRKFQQH